MRPLLKRIAALIIILCMIGSYGDKDHDSRPILSYITTNTALQILIIIGLIFLVTRLVKSEAGN